jgi:hypothetical protein
MLYVFINKPNHWLQLSGMHPNPISKARHTGCLALVFDFDETLASENLWARLYTKQDLNHKDLSDKKTMCNVFGGEERLRKLCTALKKIVDVCQVRLYIASHGVASDIEVALVTAGLFDIFKRSHPPCTPICDWLLGRDSNAQETSPRKDTFIIKMMSFQGITKVVYLDNNQQYYELLKGNPCITCVDMGDKNLDIQCIDELKGLVCRHVVVGLKPQIHPFTRTR